MDEKVVIPISKVKVLFLLSLITVLFAVLGVVIVFLGFTVESGVLLLLAIILVAFLSIVYAAFTKPLFSYKSATGLTVDNTGMTIDICTFGCFAGHIPWKDVIEISEQEPEDQASDSFIKIIVKDPEKYINKNKNFFFRAQESIDRWITGSPIIITTSTLKYSGDISALRKILLKKYNKYHSRI
ncbi:MAG: hypothetical protein FWH56_10605 [Betaproteobacteria bacterium]|nr:hypothetical protein [Betaproteobacteria bacterium]MCL2162317.1 hypothetical protein [Betaproteobacteria bacterium]